MSHPERVAYVVSRFPKTTETFIVREMEAVAAQGVEVDVVALVRETNEIVQPGAEVFLEDLRTVDDLRIGEIVRSQLLFVATRPGRWARMWWRAIAGNIASRKFLARAVVAAAGAPALARRVEERGIDRLHAHWGTHAALLAYVLHILTDIPYSITLHAHDLHTERTMLGEKLEHATDVMTISAHNQELIGALYPSAAAKTSVVHCGVDVGAIDLRTRPDNATPRLVTVAGLRDFKGHTHLLDAVDTLRADGRDVVVDLVGDGPLRPELEAQVSRLDLAEAVRFHGAVPVSDALDIVAGADVAVMPSVVLANGRRDGIPVALIEAMAIGVPVVATDVSGIPELVRDGETGSLVPQADADRLAEAIADTLDDHDAAASRVESGRDLVEREFDITSSGASMISLWSEGRGGGLSEGVDVMSRPLQIRVALVAIAAILGGLVAAGWSASQDDVFRAKVVAAFAPAPDVEVDADVIDIIGNLDRGSLPATAAGIATSGSVKADAAARIGLDSGLGAYEVDAAPVLDAVLIDIVVRGPDAQISADLANAIGEVVSERVTALYDVYTVDIVTEATPPDPADDRTVALMFAAALFAGAAMAAALVAIERLGSAPPGRRDAMS